MSKIFGKMKNEALADLLNASARGEIQSSTLADIASYITEDLGKEALIDILTGFGDDLLDFVPEEHGLPPGSTVREALHKFVALEIESFLKVQAKRLPNADKLLK